MNILENVEGLDVVGKDNMKNPSSGIAVAKSASSQTEKLMMMNVTAEMWALENAAMLDVAGKGNMKNPFHGIAAVKNVSSPMEKPTKLGVTGETVSKGKSKMTQSTKTKA